LAPGYHTCYGRDVMHYMEVTDRQFDIPMAVLCKDQLNFNFNIGVLVAVNREKTELIKEAFSNVIPTSGNTLTIQELFDMYVKPVVDQEARKVISRYETSEIASKREEVIGAVTAAVEAAISSSLLKVKRITINNMDFPDAITKAQEARAERQIAIETMKAQTLTEMEKARGQLQVAQIEYQRRLVEAAMISDANKIIGASITPEFLAWHEIKVLGQAALGPNNWGFIPYNSNTMKVLGNATLGATQERALDAELLRRLDDARHGRPVTPPGVTPPQPEAPTPTTVQPTSGRK